MSASAWSRARLCTAIAAISVGAAAVLALPAISVLTNTAPGTAAPAAASAHQGAKSAAEAEQAGPASPAVVTTHDSGVDNGKDGKHIGADRHTGLTYLPLVDGGKDGHF